MRGAGGCSSRSGDQGMWFSDTMSESDRLRAGRCTQAWEVLRYRPGRVVGGMVVCKFSLSLLQEWQRTSLLITVTACKCG